jgi:hypothetical protein
MRKLNFIYVCTALVIVISLTGCATNQKKEVDELKKEIMRLQDDIREMKELLKESRPKETPEKKVEKPQPVEPVELPPQEPTLNPQPKKIEIVKPVTTEEKETVHYYNPRMGKNKVSVRISPWKDGRRKMYLYDPFGNVTFEREDVRLGYSDTATIKKFHDNGAVAVLYIHMNPGASMYWYETTITFSINNEPEWKTSLQQPATLEDHLNSKYYWDKKTKTWKKQEIIREQPVPKEYQ